MGEGFSNFVANASGILVRTVLKSFNYVTGVSGWQIGKDGSAEFNNATIRGSLTIGGSSPNPRIVYGNVIPPALVAWGTPLNVTFNSLVLYYRNATDYFFEGIGTFSGIPLFVRGAYTNVDGPYIVERIFDLGGSTDGRIEFRLGSYALNSYFMRFMTQQVNVQIGTGSVVTGDRLTVNARAAFSNTGTDATASTDWTADAFGTTIETLNPITLQNGWTGKLDVRLVTSPPHSVQIVGAMTPGTKADGTLVGVLGVGYRPTYSADVPLSVNIMAGGAAQSPHFNLNPANGNITCWGCSAATSVGVSETFTLETL